MIILQALYFALPIYLANMAPVIFKKLPVLGCPLDSGLTFREKRLFGKNKTWRGLISGVFIAVIVVMMQQKLQVITEFAQELSLLDYSKIDVISLGMLMGFGALFGDALKSFFKRQFGRLPGSAWPPFDQLDFIVFALIFSAYIFFPGWKIVIILLLISPLLHALTNYLSFKVGVKDVPW